MVLIRVRNADSTIFGLVHVAESYSVNNERYLSLLRGSGFSKQKDSSPHFFMRCIQHNILVIKIEDSQKSHSECGL